MKIVLDTNVFVSAVLSHGTAPDLLYQHWLSGAIEVVTSEEQLDELRRVFAYPKIAQRISSEQAKEVLDNLDADATLVASLPEVKLSSDPDDNLILATAIAGGVDLLVSGDKKHLLPIGDAEGIPILAPQQALERIEASLDQG